MKELVRSCEILDEVERELDTADARRTMAEPVGA